MRIVNMMLVIDETTEAATCKMLVTNTIVEIYEQKVSTTVQVYIASILALQQQYFVAESPLWIDAIWES